MWEEQNITNSFLLKILKLLNQREEISDRKIELNSAPLNCMWRRLESRQYSHNFSDYTMQKS